MKRFALLSVILTLITSCGFTKNKSNQPKPAPLNDPFANNYQEVQRPFATQVLTSWMSAVEEPAHGVWHGTMNRVRDDRVGNTNYYYYYVAEYIGMYSSVPNKHFDFSCSHFFEELSNFTISNGYDQQNFLPTPIIGNGIQAALNWMNNANLMQYTKLYDVDGQFGLYYYQPGDTQKALICKVNSDGFITYYEDSVVSNNSKTHRTINVSYTCYIL